MAAKSTPSSLPISLVLQLAAKEVGVEEEPRGSNRGPRVRKYLQATGLPEGYAWCAAFVAFIGLLATNGLPVEDAVPGFDHWPLPHTADCDVLLYKARKLGILRDEPKVGDLFLVMASANDATHVGFVRGVNADGSIATFEGNSNKSGSREGYAVVDRPSRSVRNLKFVRWIDAITIPSKPWKVYLRNGEGKTKLICGEAFLQEGNSYIPVRDYLLALGFPDASLRWNDETQGLDYLNKPLPVQTLFRGDGRAWGQVRQLAAYNGLALEIDGTARTITVFRAES